MRQSNLFLTIIAACLPLPAAAAEPVNLHCSVKDGVKVSTIDLTLNEAEQTVTWQWDDYPEPISGPAVFSATKVVMKTITIDRVHLTLEQRYDAGDGVVIKRGTCKIQKVTRAF